MIVGAGPSVPSGSQTDTARSSPELVCSYTSWRSGFAVSMADSPNVAVNTFADPPADVMAPTRTMTTARFAAAPTPPSTVAAAPARRRPRRTAMVPTLRTISPTRATRGATVGAKRDATVLSGPSPGTSDATPMIAAITPTTIARARAAPQTAFATARGPDRCDELVLSVIFSPRLSIFQVGLRPGSDPLAASRC